MHQCVSSTFVFAWPFLIDEQCGWNKIEFGCNLAWIHLKS